MPVTSTVQQNSTRRNKGERVNLRLTREQKRIVLAAARRENRSLSQFMVSSSTRSALRIFAEANPLILSEDERTALAEILVNPPEANEDLRALFAEFGPVED